MNKLQFKNNLKRIGINPDSFLIGSGNGFPVFSIKKYHERKIAHYAIKLFENKNIFMVWNLQRRRDCRKDGSEGSLLGLTEKSWDAIPCGMDTFLLHYKALGKKNSGIYEKIYVVGISHFHEFFQNYISYMKINEEDDECPFDAKKDEAWGRLRKMMLRFAQTNTPTP